MIATFLSSRPASIDSRALIVEISLGECNFVNGENAFTKTRHDEIKEIILNKFLILKYPNDVISEFQAMRKVFLLYTN